MCVWFLVIESSNVCYTCFYILHGIVLGMSFSLIIEFEL